MMLIGAFSWPLLMPAYVVEEEDDEDDDDDDEDDVAVTVAADEGASNCRVPESKRTKTNGAAGLGWEAGRGRAEGSD